MLGARPHPDGPRLPQAAVEPLPQGGGGDAGAEAVGEAKVADLGAGVGTLVGAGDGARGPAREVGRAAGAVLAEEGEQGGLDGGLDAGEGGLEVGRHALVATVVGSVVAEGGGRAKRVRWAYPAERAERVRSGACAERSVCEERSGAKG